LNVKKWRKREVGVSVSDEDRIGDNRERKECKKLTKDVFAQLVWRGSLFELEKHVLGSLAHRGAGHGILSSVNTD
jgi:hypothetical protein